jgi:hypothetical protein
MRLPKAKKKPSVESSTTAKSGGPTVLCAAGKCTRSGEGRLNGLCYIHGGRKLCAESGCVKFVQRKGLCCSHYTQARAAANPTPEGRKVCSENGCDKFVQRKGLCCSHYTKSRAVHANDDQRPTCTKNDCEKFVQRKGLCHTHYAVYRAVSRGFELSSEFVMAFRFVVYFGCLVPALGIVLVIVIVQET